MAERYTADDLLKVTNGYAIEVEVGQGQKARIVGQSAQALLISANELYQRSVKGHRMDNRGRNHENQ